jgi:lactate dehydrogenase-like 2-hydroxyacid dehydrogenase
MTLPSHVQIAVLDDYQDVALRVADWSALRDRATVTAFNDHVADEAAIVARLLPFDVVCVMRERTPLTRSILERLPRLRLIASTGQVNASIDLNAARERGVQVVHTGYSSTPAIELTWALADDEPEHRSGPVIAGLTGTAVLAQRRATSVRAA